MAVRAAAAPPRAPTRCATANQTASVTSKTAHRTAPASPPDTTATIGVPDPLVPVPIVRQFIQLVGDVVKIFDHEFIATWTGISAATWRVAAPGQYAGRVAGDVVLN